MAISKCLIALVLAAPLVSAQAAALDFWTGTVELQGNALYLSRCDAAKNRYKLAGSKQILSNLRSQLGAENIKPGQHLVAELVAAHRLDKADHTLVVDSISSARVGTSCHLSDALSGS